MGKTVVAAVMARTAHAAGARVAVFKPAVSGLDDYPLRPETWDCAPELPDHVLLRLASGSAQGDDEITPYRYAAAVSPHLAAELAGEPIDPDLLRGAALDATEDCDLLICEGVGGFLVPLTPRYLVRDLARDLAMPVVVVAAPGLGTINHTLLTIEALRRRSIYAAGVIMVGVPNADNRDAIERYGRIDVLGVMPGLDPLTPASLAAWASAELDPDGRLARLLQ